MEQNSPHINKCLIPLSWLYGLVVYVRKKLFDWGVLKHEKFDIPVISIGNITVGGTGKTPHVEYLVRLLKNSFNVAVLSRGYKRKTKGFVLATNSATYKDLGDEPYQIKEKFFDITVAVDEDRRRGIEKLLSMKDSPDVILLDDAYQHLYVKPSLSILLTDYNRPMHKDRLLPAGRLRENADNIDRANIVIVTKCPSELKPIDMRIIRHDLNIYPYQTLIFTTVKYGNLVSMFGQTDLFSKEEQPLEMIRDRNVLLLTGIASPEPILEELKNYTDSVRSVNYPDHHDFTSDDIRNIEEKYKELNDPHAITIVTEKDAVRLMHREDLSDKLKRSLYYLPIEISFLNKEDKIIFNKKVYSHVRKNSRNSEFSQE
ncbi:MAG: tetraacyldisaccharide 4'-kinase [Dysgonomonas sp.]